MSRDEMRAGDGDREAVATRLKEALDQGRLDLHEYDERLQQVYAAKTYGELDSVTRDLPGTIPAERAQVVPQQSQAPQATAGPAPDGKQKPYLTGYAGVVLVCVVIWLLSSLGSGTWQYFWPGWMLIPLIFGWIGQRRNRGR